MILVTKGNVHLLAHSCVAQKYRHVWIGPLLRVSQAEVRVLAGWAFICRFRGDPTSSLTPVVDQS